MAAKLLAQFGEVEMPLGQIRSGLLVVYVNPVTLTWTLVGLMPDGAACLIGSGTDWASAVPEREGTPL